MMLHRKRLTYIKTEIKEAKGDSKQLYNLVVVLSGTKKVNPLPDGQDNKQLANNFAEYFSNKIETIRQNLDVNPLYDPPQRQVNNKL